MFKNIWNRTIGLSYRLELLDGSAEVLLDPGSDLVAFCN